MFFLKVTGRLMNWALATFFLAWLSGEEVIAHSSDFVFARWSQNAESGLIELSLSIQISDNPNIENRQQAIEVLTKLMWVRSGLEGELVSVESLAEAGFEEGNRFPQDSPVPIGGAGLEQLESGVVADENETEHEILTLKWTWRASAEVKQMSFFMPDDSQQNVVFWWADAVAPDLPPGKEIPWQIMLGGDESFPVALIDLEGEELERAGSSGIRWITLLVFGAVFIFVLIIGFLIVGKNRAK